MKPALKGFTLLEMLISLVIVGILAGVAIPSYLSYTQKAYYAEVVRAAGPAKLAVAACYQSIGTLTGCSGGSNNIPNDIPSGSSAGAVDSITTLNGTITILPTNAHGIESTDSYILTPSLSADGFIIWTVSGGGVDKGYTR